MKKQLITLLFIGFQTFLFSQKSISANVNMGRNYSDCNHPGSFCGVDSNTTKSNANATITYNNEKNELTFIFSNTTLDTTNKSKLLNNKLEKDFYLYTFDEDFILPKEIKDALNIKNLSKIKKGNYLVKIVKGQIIMKLKLE